MEWRSELSVVSYSLVLGCSCRSEESREEEGGRVIQRERAKCCPRRSIIVQEVLVLFLILAR